MVFPARRWMWRGARKLYMAARGDQPNEMSANGETRLQRLAVAACNPDSPMVVFDVGARIGDWSRAFVDCAAGRAGGYVLHVFEPVPDSLRQLRANLAGPGSSGEVRINGIALSNESRTQPIYVPQFTGGTSTLLPDPATHYEQVIEVRTSTIDRYCADNSIDRVDLIKIDTEGNDFRVLEGASRLLGSGNAGIVQFEYNHRWINARSYLKDVFDLVRRSPYRVAKVCSTALEVYEAWHPELERFFETNYALIHERLVAALGCDLYRIGYGNAFERVPAAGAPHDHVVQRAS